jgi:nucleoside-diphosphate-sugar epimerase
VEVLVIGGNRFVGRSLVFALLFRRHRVTVLNRGTLATPAGVGSTRSSTSRRSPPKMRTARFASPRRITS